MRDRVRVQDFSILLVCPSRRWGTLERRAILDAVILRDLGANPYLYCIRDSYLEKEAIKQDIPLYYFEGKKINEFIDFSYYFSMGQILKDKEFDVIHCYNLKYLWALSLLLMRKTKIPLFLTFNRNLTKSTHGLINRWLYKRVDLIFAFADGVFDMAHTQIPVPPRKFKSLGLGIEKSLRQDEKSDDLKVWGAFIGKQGGMKEKVQTILYAFSGFVQEKKDQNQTHILRLCVERNWSDFAEFKDIYALTQELNLVNRVEFLALDASVMDELLHFDFLINAEFQEPITDFELMAIIHGIPLIMPRTAVRAKILEEWKGVALNYARGNARELRLLMHVLSQDESQVSAAQLKHVDNILETHGIDSYLSELISHYERFYQKRSSIEILRAKKASS